MPSLSTILMKNCVQILFIPLNNIADCVKLQMLKTWTQIGYGKQDGTSPIFPTSTYGNCERSGNDLSEKRGSQRPILNT